jgi:DivIVA domain-containing protein
LKVVFVFERDRSKTKNSQPDSGPLPPAVSKAVAELVPDILRPSTFRQAQFRAQFLGGYDPSQVDAVFGKSG